MSNIQIYATLFKNGGSFISHLGVNVGVGVLGVLGVTHAQANLLLCEHSKQFIDFRGSYLSLQLARRHSQTEGWLLAEGPGHQQTFIPHLLQTHHHLMEPHSTLTRMEQLIISGGTQSRFTLKTPSHMVERCLFYTWGNMLRPIQSCTTESLSFLTDINHKSNLLYLTLT